MATRNIVPRANNEGSLGTSSKNWSDVRATAATITTVNATTVVPATVTPSAGTASVAPIVLTAGTNLTSAAAGAIEKDANCFYSTPIASARGVSPSTMYAIVEAGDFALATTSGVQSCFPATKDVWTLAASTTYLFEGVYYITHSTTSCTAAMAFAAAGLTVTDIRYEARSTIVAENGAPAATTSTFVGQIASTVVAPTSTVGWVIAFKGLLRTNAGGTLTPQINWSANTTVPVMKASSYIMFTPLGTNTNNTVGNVA